MLNFCTLFDKNYLTRGIALYTSLQTHCAAFSLYVLCLDDFTFHYLKQLNYPHLIPILLTELEDFDRDLFEAKSNRTLIEYYFTLSPCLPLFLFKKYPHLTWICSLDADIYFYSNPQFVFDAFHKNYSILITPHKFTTELLETGIEKYGIYNVSFQAFKKDEIGLKCLEKWRSDCLNWCKQAYDSENNRFADQKYLDTWTTDFPNKVMVLTDAVTGLAVWNINNYALSLTNNLLFSNGESVVFFHFHALNTYHTQFNKQVRKRYLVVENAILNNFIYEPYITKIKCLNTDALVFNNNYLSAIASINKALFYDAYVIWTKIKKRIFALINSVNEQNK